MSTVDLQSVLEPSSLLVTAGPGGVGKTTTAAALGMAAALDGRRTVVMTVDPARRLADALGLDVEGSMNDPHRVELPAGAGGATGELWALMLDAEETFDRLVREQAGTESAAERILDNPVYRAISGSLAGAQEYMAIERLHQLHSSGEWDLVIVDTPPSRHALDLLEAPDRLVAFLGHPVYRTLTLGQRAFAKVTNAAASMFLWAVRRLAGPQIVEDTLEFFRSLSLIEGGLRRRADEVRTLLRAPSTTFVAVTSPRAEAIREARHLVEGLEAGDFPLGGVVVNLVHPVPEPMTSDDLTLVEEAVAARPDGPLADHLDWYRELSAIAAAEGAQLDSLRGFAGEVPIVEVPLRPLDVNDLDVLTEIARHLAGLDAD